MNGPIIFYPARSLILLGVGTSHTCCCQATDPVTDPRDFTKDRAGGSKAPRRLDDNQVHLWLYQVETVSAEAIARSKSWLNRFERERCDRLAGLERQRALLSRGLLRWLLFVYFEREPAAWEFETGEHGKPAVVDAPATFCFNLSHSGSWIACAIACDGDLGLDVQLRDPARRYERLAKRYFTDTERARLAQLSTPARGRYFYDLWSLKEALTKARGGALPTALGKAGFSLENERIDLVGDDPAIGADLSLLSLAADYSLALCHLPGVSRRAEILAFEGAPGERGRPLALALEAATRPRSSVP